MTASVYLKPDQVSLAIGKGGLNIRLSKMLTGYDIDVYREVEEEDVALTEFADEIDGWIIDALKSRRLRHAPRACWNSPSRRSPHAPTSNWSRRRRSWRS